MIFKKKEAVEWFEFEQLSPFPFIRHGVFSRQGGESLAPYDSLNLSKSQGDDPLCVERNLKIVQRVLEIPKLISCNQTHGDQILCFSSQKGEYLSEYDALITKEKEIGVLITHADCQAAIFFDPIERVIANVHVGWKGNVHNLYGKTVQVMKEKFGCYPQNLLVCISPSLGPSASEFKNYRLEFPENFWRFQIKPNYFDLWEISKMQLLESGVLLEHIEIARICTYTDSKNFFSYRREKKTGRNGTVVALVS